MHEISLMENTLATALTQARNQGATHIHSLKMNVGQLSGVVPDALEFAFDIVAKGDPNEWGGSPAGSYYVISKQRVAYSSVSEVYMPWSIRYYGKYYIHGEPYYPGGEKLNSSTSGGCIRN